MTLSFLVTVHNEDRELDILLEQLSEYITANAEDEIVVLDDFSDNPKTLEIFEKYKDHIRIVQHKLDKNFGAHKQWGNEQCKGDFIFQVDADEYFADELLNSMKGIIEDNPEVELYWIPRLNIMRNLTAERARPWGWKLGKIEGIQDTETYNDESPEYQFLKQYGFITHEKRISDNQMEVTCDMPIINYPDCQSRLYANKPHVKWSRPLHEHVVGAEVQTQLPSEPGLSLIHDKTIDRQEKQNNFYMTNFSEEMNVRK